MTSGRVDPLPVQMTEGFDETAAVCALQRAGNNIGKCREYLDAPVMKENFKESAAVGAAEGNSPGAASPQGGCVARCGIHKHPLSSLLHTLTPDARPGPPLEPAGA